MPPVFTEFQMTFSNVYIVFGRFSSACPSPSSASMSLSLSLLSLAGTTACSSHAPTPFLWSSWGFAIQEWPGGQWHEDTMMTWRQDTNVP